LAASPRKPNRPPEETRELLREPLQLRGLRMLGGEVSRAAPRRFWPEARLAAIAFASPPTLKDASSAGTGFV